MGSTGMYIPLAAFFCGDVVGGEEFREVKEIKEFREIKDFREGKKLYS